MFLSKIFACKQENNIDVGGHATKKDTIRNEHNMIGSVKVAPVTKKSKRKG